MRAITEAMLRAELRSAQPESYSVSEGKILTPAAREYLQQRKIKVTRGEPARSPCVPAAAPPPAPVLPPALYTDYETGGFYTEKPEHMTQLSGNLLVAKSHPRIRFRGKLDSLQAQVVLAQVAAAEAGRSKLTEDLGDLLEALRELMRCDVLDEEFRRETMVGLTHAQLRERSHDPERFFGIRRMALPAYTMGREYALLNHLRTAVREAETVAVEAFRGGGTSPRSDIIEALNRMSSALHIMMCMTLAGQYGTEGAQEWKKS
ncbi:MAG: ATP-binding protein [Pseudoflavonifractor sp.]